MSNRITGCCHCGNLTFELHTRLAPEAIRARACDCGFCRMHGARTWSDPQGSVTLRVADGRQLQRYRFGLRTADFLVCRVCGAYLGALLQEGDHAWSTVNLRLAGLDVHTTAASYGAEGADERIARRRRAWTPTTVVIELP